MGVLRFFSPFLFILIVACGPQVKFVQPQPRDGKNLSQIPIEFRGKYINISDSSGLTVDSVRVVAMWISHEFIHKDSIAALEKDLNITIQRDTQLILSHKRPDWLSSGVNVVIKFVDDSVRVDALAESILFEISDSQLVRKYRGCCFLNTLSENGLWLVKVLQLCGRNLKFGDLLDADQVQRMNHLTRVPGTVDSLSGKPQEYYLNPTRRELRRILKNRINGDLYVLVKD